VYVEDADLPGPSKWGNLAAVCGNGRFQSPINIISSYSYYYANFGSLNIDYHKYDTSITATETGQGVTLNSPTFNDNFLTVKNVLNGTYVLESINFHWGQVSNKVCLALHTHTHTLTLCLSVCLSVLLC
jgi:carbonic anhydrase